MLDLAEKIAQVDEIDMEELFQAVRQRYAVLFPGWEAVVIFVERSSDRNEQLDRIIGILQNMKS